MAHNIHYNENTEKHSFFSVKEKAWHGLGQVVEDYPTSSEAIKHAGLDYTVEKRPVYTHDTRDFNGIDKYVIPDIDVPNYFATVRTDNDAVLGVVGRDYQIVQNANAFAFFDAIVGNDSDIRYETAGALGKGERVFITAKLPDYIKVGRGDCIEKYLFLTTSHDGFGSITAAFTPVRIVCNNTLNAAMHNLSNAIKIRHTSSAESRLKEAHKLMGISNQFATELESVFNSWAKTRITDRQLKNLVQVAMSPNRETLEHLKAGRTEELSTVYTNSVSSVMEYALISPSQQEETTKGTLFGAYNAVTGYYQNVKNFKDGESRFTSIMQGTGKERGQTAFNLCRDFARYGGGVDKLR